MVDVRLPEIPVVFYRTIAGNEPVRDWLRGLPTDDRRRLGTDLATVQVGWPIGMPLCRALGGGLWEIRTRLGGNRIARILFFAEDNRIGVVNGFIKKTRRHPPRKSSLPGANAGDEGMSQERNLHWGSTLEDFLVEEGIRESAMTEAVTRVVHGSSGRKWSVRG